MANWLNRPDPLEMRRLNPILKAVQWHTKILEPSLLRRHIIGSYNNSKWRGQTYNVQIIDLPDSYVIHSKKLGQ